MESLFIIELPFAKIQVKSEDVDDIMDTAMTGCTYWCEKVEPVGGYLGKYASDQISRGGTLKFFPFSDNSVELTLNKFKEGLRKYYLSIKKDLVNAVNVDNNSDCIEIDSGCIDAAIADTILQYALFDDIIYS